MRERSTPPSARSCFRRITTPCTSTARSPQEHRRTSSRPHIPTMSPQQCVRSEERRVGKGVDLGGRRIIKKKKKTKKTQNNVEGKTRSNTAPIPQDPVDI